MIREAASKTRLCKVSRPICIISVVAASLSLHPSYSSPSFSRRKLESRRRERKRNRDSSLDSKNFIQYNIDLFKKDK